MELESPQSRLARLRLEHPVAAYLQRQEERLIRNLKRCGDFPRPGQPSVGDAVLGALELRLAEIDDWIDEALDSKGYSAREHYSGHRSMAGMLRDVIGSVKPADCTLPNVVWAFVPRLCWMDRDLPELSVDGAEDPDAEENRQLGAADEAAFIAAWLLRSHTAGRLLLEADGSIPAKRRCNGQAVSCDR